MFEIRQWVLEFSPDLESWNLKGQNKKPLWANQPFPLSPFLRSEEKDGGLCLCLADSGLSPERYSLAVSWMLFANSSFPGFWHALCCQSYWFKPLVDFKTFSPCIVTDVLKMDFLSSPDLHFSVGRADAKQVVLRFQIEAVSSYRGINGGIITSFVFLSLYIFIYQKRKKQKKPLYTSQCIRLIQISSIYCC